MKNAVDYLFTSIGFLLWCAAALLTVVGYMVFWGAIGLIVYAVWSFFFTGALPFPP